MPINQDYILYVAEEDAAKQKELLMKPEIQKPDFNLVKIPCKSLLYFVILQHEFISR
jgi:hypothetical protein